MEGREGRRKETGGKEEEEWSRSRRKTVGRRRGEKEDERKERKVEKEDELDISLSIQREARNNPLVPLPSGPKRRKHDLPILFTLRYTKLVRVTGLQTSLFPLLKLKTHEGRIPRRTNRGKYGRPRMGCLEGPTLLSTEFSTQRQKET